MHSQTMFKRYLLCVGISFILLPLAASYAQDWSLPTSLVDKISSLAPEQQRFITDGEAIKFLPEQQLIHEINTRDADSLQTLVNDLMSVAAQMAYDPARDMGAIPLNIGNTDFFSGVVTPKPLREMQRDDGPFSTNRYMFPTSGVSTFAGAKVAIYPEDLTAGKVDVAIIGVPSDFGSGRRGASFGPNNMRALNTIATRDPQSLLDPMEVLSVVDYGNFFVDKMSAERSVNHISAMVAETLATKAIPMLVGGDTSILYSAVKGVAQVKGEQSFGLVHFSAHPDAQRQAAHTISDVQAVFKLLNEGIVDGKDVVQVGLRGQDIDIKTLEWLGEQGVHYHTMAAINERGYASVLKKIKREVKRGPEQIFVSVDVSVIDPSEMVAAGRLVSGGLTLRELTEALRYMCAAKDIVGFEITDMSPMLDYSRLSAVNANAVLNACLVGVAVRKAGLKPDYVHPLALNHGN
jgi:agmatinase